MTTRSMGRFTVDEWRAWDAGTWSTHSAPETRQTPEQLHEIDVHCALTPSQRVVIFKRTMELRNLKPLLGRYIRRRWSPKKIEKRSLKSKVQGLVQKHTARLSDALQLGTVSTVAKVIQDVYTDSYGYEGDLAQAVTDAPQLSSLLSEANQWAGNLLAKNPPDDTTPAEADTLAASVAQDASVAADAASTLDAATNNGSQVQWELDSDRACQVCRDNADGGPYDPSDAPDAPAHKGCQCEITEVTQ